MEKLLAYILTDTLPRTTAKAVSTKARLAHLLRDGYENNGRRFRPPEGRDIR